MFHLPSLARLAGLTPRAVAEIGVHGPEQCRMEYFVGLCPTLLVEPLPDCAQRLREAYPLAIVVEKACANTEGTLPFYHRGQTSWLVGLPHTPAIDVDHHQVNAGNIHPVEAILFSSIDPGNLDIVAIDTEGSEWFTLKHMISRPKLLVIETHAPSWKYTNPYLAEITAWTKENGYTQIAQEFADTLYARL